MLYNYSLDPDKLISLSAAIPAGQLVLEAYDTWGASLYTAAGEIDIHGPAAFNLIEWLRGSSARAVCAGDTNLDSETPMAYGLKIKANADREAASRFYIYRSQVIAAFSWPGQYTCRASS